MKILSLASVVTITLLAATGIASTQQINQQPNPAADAPTGQQPDSSKGLGTGSSAGDQNTPNARQGTTGVAPTTGMQQAPGASDPQAKPKPEPGVVRPSEAQGQRPGDKAQ